MIDSLALLIFGLAIVYTVFRAIKLDQKMPWFTKDSEPPAPTVKRKREK